MYFWRIRLNFGKGCTRDVYYRSAMELSKQNVPINAVIDEMMINNDLPFVEKVDIIDAKEYYEHMWE